MTLDEKSLKAAIKAGPTGTFLLYGEESYLTERYARLIAQAVVDEESDPFDLQRFAGDEVTPDRLEDAIDALPLMADKKCILVRDIDPTADPERICALPGRVADGCVLIFYQMTLQPDRKKAWQELIRSVDAAGSVVRFDRLTTAEAARLLTAGAKRRGCTMDPAAAQLLVEQAGNDLQLLQGELDKLSALAQDGQITPQLIERAATKDLEARVFDLSKAILAGRDAAAYDLLHRLAVQREEPIAVLGVLSNAYADLYRARIARDAGAPVQALTEAFRSYKGKEFRVRNAMRDAARLSVPALRDMLQTLAAADTALKTGRGDGRTVLEETVARLLMRARQRA